MKCGICGNEFRAKEMKLGRAGYKEITGKKGVGKQIVVVCPECKVK